MEEVFALRLGAGSLNGMLSPSCGFWREGGGGGGGGGGEGGGGGHQLLAHT